MAFETQNINNPLNAHQHNVDVNSLKESLKAYGERSEDKKQEKTELKIEEVIHQLVSANLPVAEKKAMLAVVLPLEKRLLIQNMILAEERRQRSIMTPQQYEQYLQAQFPNGVPSNIGEIVLPTLKSAFEGYQLVGQKINETNLENPSEIEKRELSQNKREATVVTQVSEKAAKKLSDELSRVPEQVRV